MRSPPLWPTTMATHSAMARRASFGSTRCRSTASRPIPGAFIRCTAMSGSGARTPTTCLPAWFAAVPGTTFQSTSARRTATGSNAAAGTSASASGLREFFLLPERSNFLPLYNFTSCARRAIQGTDPIFSAEGGPQVFSVHDRVLPWTPERGLGHRCCGGVNRRRTLTPDRRAILTPFVRRRCAGRGRSCGAKQSSGGLGRRGGGQDRCLSRQLSFPVSTMSQWCVRRSSSAVVIFASPNTCGHSAKARLVVTMIDVRS